MQNTAFEIMRRRFSMQLILEHLMKNLERARPVNESAIPGWRRSALPIAIRSRSPGLLSCK